MRYKNFDLSIGLQGVLGNKIYNATRQTLEDVTKGSNFLASCLDYWTPENKNASHPRLTWDDPNRNTRAESDRYLENGSYLRLRSVQLGYTFPQTWFKGAIQHARVYINAETYLLSPVTADIHRMSMQTMPIIGDLIILFTRLTVLSC